MGEGADLLRRRQLLYDLHQDLIDFFEKLVLLEVLDVATRASRRALLVCVLGIFLGELGWFFVALELPFVGRWLVGLGRLAVLSDVLPDRFLVLEQVVVFVEDLAKVCVGDGLERFGWPHHHEHQEIAELLVPGVGVQANQLHCLPDILHRGGSKLIVVSIFKLGEKLRAVVLEEAL